MAPPGKPAATERLKITANFTRFLSAVIMLGLVTQSVSVFGFGKPGF